MARPQKEGLDYFPLDVDVDQDDKITLVEAAHGLVGFGIIIRLFMLIYKNSYFYSWTEKELLLFSKRVNVDINKINDVIKDCIRWEIFDEKIYEKYEILTSKGIQKRYIKAVDRRTEIRMFKEYILLEKQDIGDNVKIVNVDNNSDNVGIYPQSKEKNIKEQDIKEYNNIYMPGAEAPDSMISLILNDKTEFPIFQNQIDEWSELYPAVDILQELRNMKGWCISNPAKRKTKSGILRFVNSWLAKKQNKGYSGTQNRVDNFSDFLSKKMNENKERDEVIYVDAKRSD